MCARSVSVSDCSKGFVVSCAWLFALEGVGTEGNTLMGVMVSCSAKDVLGGRRGFLAERGKSLCSFLKVSFSWIAGCPGGGDPHLTSVGYFKAAEIKET